MLNAECRTAVVESAIGGRSADDDDGCERRAGEAAQHPGVGRLVELDGELAVANTLEKYFIVRTAWLYGVNGRNFPRTMLELAQNHSEITVVYDEVGTPTYTPDLAKGISKLIETDYYGTYHLTNSGNCSWCEFARYIFEVADVDVNVIPVTASEFARPAPRPSYSVLENRNWVENGFEPLRNYKEAIKEYIELIK